jgi:histone deacetylase 11
MRLPVVFSPASFALPPGDGRSNLARFDPWRGARALAALQDAGLPLAVLPPDPVPAALFAAITTPEARAAATDPAALAAIAEVPGFARLPLAWLERGFVAPQRVGLGGTLAAARAARAAGRALHLAGGYHHAAPAGGAGFGVWNDLALAVAGHRAAGNAGPVLIVDLDAHAGNGTARAFAGDPSVSLLDLFRSPGWPDDAAATAATRWPRPLPPGCDGPTWRAALAEGLVAATAAGPWSLVLVVVGADPLPTDPLGGLAVPAADLAAGHAAVARAFAGTAQAWVCAGGYGPDAYRVLVAAAQALAAAPAPR